MDLIYADETGKDINVLPSYKMDMAYGKDENDFAVCVDRNDHCCYGSYLIYAEGTEYGGIVDKIKSDTDAGEVTYTGRTWHGVLAGKTICPDPGDDYYTVSGEANTVLQMIIDRIGLSGTFIASTEDTGVIIRSWQFDRYCDAYSGIRKMLKSYGLKLKLQWAGNMVEISAVPVRDYSQDEEFDASQVPFTVEQNYNPVNHLICLGQGNLRDRAVIHIFTDKHGGVQPYLVDPTKEPVEDSDYILDTSSQLLFGREEVAEVYELSNAEITTNYVLLTEQPADWSDNYAAYYVKQPTISVVGMESLNTGSQYGPVKDEGGYSLQTAQPGDWSTGYGKYYTYDQLAGTYSAVQGSASYSAVSTQPGDWSSNYRSYFRKNGSDYLPVEGAVTSQYVEQDRQPADWSSNYGSYYELDGSSYVAVVADSHYSYDLQTQEPADWSTNYAAYYRRATSKELDAEVTVRYYSVTLDHKGRVPVWQGNTYYTRTFHQGAPVWSAAARYTRIDTASAPAWSSGIYKQALAAPTWQANTYYTNAGSKAPAWKAGTYYRQAIDRYKVLVAGAIDKINTAYKADDLKINLEETDRIYDVGDIVGAKDDVTGQGAVQEVTKKIITIENGDVNIRYEVD